MCHRGMYEEITKSKKRRRLHHKEQEDDDDYDIRRRHKASSFFDEEAAVDTDDELEDEEDEVEEGFIVDPENDLPDEDDSRGMPQHRFLPPAHQDDDDEYLEAVERSIHERYRRHRFADYDDEIEKFRKPVEGGDVASVSTLYVNRKKVHFVKDDAVIVVKGDLKNLKGRVEKVYEDNVHIRPEIKGLPKTVAVNDKELVKYFELGNHVKVVSGAQAGATGMVVKVEQKVLILVSDTTKEHVRVFADDVIESSEVTTDAYGRFCCLKSPPRIPKSPKRFFGCGKVGWRHRGGRGHDGLTGVTVKVRQGLYKGYRGRVIEVKRTFVEVELETQMKIVTVDRDHITDNVAVTPMHPSRTPLHPYMTPMRDPGGMVEWRL